MAKVVLVDKSLVNAKPKLKDYRLTDVEGFYLLVKANGAKWWRYDFSFNAKRKTISLGVYPDVSLASARAEARKLNELVASGVDPSVLRQADKAARKLSMDNALRKAQGLFILGSFEHVARDWLGSIQHTTREITHRKKCRRLERYVFPAIGDVPIGNVRSSDVLALLKPLIEAMKLETAHRVNAEVIAIFNFAIVHNRCEFNPAMPVAKQIPAIKVVHRPAIIDPVQVGQLLRAIYAYEGTFVVQMAFRLSPLLFQRPGEIRQMQWKDVFFEAKEWRYFVSKTNINHIVPLSNQAVDILLALKPLTGGGRFVFPSARNDGRPMSDNAIRSALRSLGYDNDTMTPHGFRTIASTHLNELGFSPDAIERQLCHMPQNKIRDAYNRAEYLQERRLLMQRWADFLDNLRRGDGVVKPL